MKKIEEFKSKKITGNLIFGSKVVNTDIEGSCDVFNDVNDNGTCDLGEVMIIVKC